MFAIIRSVGVLVYHATAASFPNMSLVVLVKWGCIWYSSFKLQISFLKLVMPSLIIQQNYHQLLFAFRQALVFYIRKDLMRCITFDTTNSL